MKPLAIKLKTFKDQEGRWWHVSFWTSRFIQLSKTLKEWITHARKNYWLIDLGLTRVPTRLPLTKIVARTGLSKSEISLFVVKHSYSNWTCKVYNDRNRGGNEIKPKKTKSTIHCIFNIRDFVHHKFVPERHQYCLAVLLFRHSS